MLGMLVVQLSRSGFSMSKKRTSYLSNAKLGFACMRREPRGTRIRSSTSMGTGRQVCVFFCNNTHPNSALWTDEHLSGALLTTNDGCKCDFLRSGICACPHIRNRTTGSRVTQQVHGTCLGRRVVSIDSRGRFRSLGRRETTRKNSSLVGHRKPGWSSGSTYSVAMRFKAVYIISHGAKAFRVCTAYAVCSMQ